MADNHFARASELHGALHEVVLPGTEKPVLLRDLPVYEFAAAGSLPMTLALKLTGESGKKAELTDQDVRDYAEWVKHAVSLVFVRPRCAPPEMWGKMDVAPPSPPCREGDEDNGATTLLDPTLLPPEAQQYLVQFVKGEIDAAGCPVARFRTTSGSAAADRADREDVSSEAELDHDGKPRRV